MDKSREQQIPDFLFLGYHIRNINFNRIAHEDVAELRIKVNSKEYNQETKIFSLTMSLEIDFETSKNNVITLLGGFEINNEELINGKNINVVSIFAASLYPFLRNSVYNITFDDREPIKMPTLDFRYIDTNRAIIINRK